jgi:hypothetical protein
MARNATIDGQSVLDLKRIVAYWTVHGAFTFAEFFIDFFVFIIPMYYEAKILFLLWLVHSDFSGAIFFFDNFIDEILSKHEFDIDESLQNTKKAFKRQISAGVGVLADAAAQAGVAALRKVLSSSFFIRHSCSTLLKPPCMQSQNMVLDGLRPDANAPKPPRFALASFTIRLPRVLTSSRTCQWSHRGAGRRR